MSAQRCMKDRDAVRMSLLTRNSTVLTAVLEWDTNMLLLAGLVSVNSRRELNLGTPVDGSRSEIRCRLGSCMPPLIGTISRSWKGHWV
jgi:hypothetical protein